MEDQNTLVGIVVAVIVLALVLWFALRKRHTDNLRNTFGDEYDRTVEDKGRREAEADLDHRKHRVADLDIVPLSRADRDRYVGEWQDVKALFVDSPTEAVLRADRTLAGIMKARGYPMADFDRRYEDLTVNHADEARHYREGHTLAERGTDATTEELRQAMNHFEELFDRMVTADDAVVDRDGDGVDDRVEAHDRQARTFRDPDGDGRAEI